MSSDFDIKMSLYDTLELDTIIKESSIASNPIGTIKYDSVDDSSKYNLEGIETHTSVFDPNDSGIFTVPINGQELKIKVTDPSNISSSTVDTFEEILYEDQGQSLTDKYSGDLSYYSRQQTKVHSGNYALKNTNDGGMIAETSDLNHPQSGETWECWINHDGGRGLSYGFFIELNNDGTIKNGYSHGYNTNGTPRHTFYEYVDSSNTNTYKSGGLSDYSNSWVRLECDHDDVNGEFNIKLYAPDGTVEDSKTITYNNHTSGGIIFNGGGANNQYWDDFVVSSRK